MTSRRDWLQVVGSSFLSASAIEGPIEKANTAVTATEAPLPLTEYEPRSMLHVHETEVPHARYALIDTHTHLSWSTKSEHGVPLAAEREFISPPSELLPIMERKNIRALVNLTGGYGDGLREAISRYDKAHPGRFYTFTEPSYSRLLEPNYPKLQADAIGDAHTAGARGLKTSLGSTWSTKDIFREPGEVEFEARTIDTFRIMRAETVK